MTRYGPEVAPDIVACIVEDRFPTVQELARVARRIALEASPAVSAGTVMAPPDTPWPNAAAFRWAQAALAGSEAPHGPQDEGMTR